MNIFSILCSFGVEKLLSRVYNTNQGVVFLEYYELWEEHVGFPKDNGLFFQMTYNDSTKRILIPKAHSHTFYEIVYIFNGYCIHNINGKSLRCGGGNMSVLLPGDIHYFESSRDNTAVMCISVTKSFMEKYTDFSKILSLALNDKRTERSVQLDHSQNLIITSLCAPEFSFADNWKNNIEKIKLLLLMLLGFYSINNQTNYQKEYSDFKTAHLNNALIQMSRPDNIREGMNALLRLTNFSHSYLCKIFKAKYNITPHQYIVNQKMQYAYDLMKFSDDSFEEIAEKVGYSSYSHFTKAVTKYYNQTPSQLRKNSERVHSFSKPDI